MAKRQSTCSGCGVPMKGKWAGSHDVRDGRVLCLGCNLVYALMDGFVAPIVRRGMEFIGTSGQVIWVVSFDYKAPNQDVTYESQEGTHTVTRAEFTELLYRIGAVRMPALQEVKVRERGKWNTHHPVIHL